MSYQEIDGKVVLTISHEDYVRMLTMLGIATRAMPRSQLNHCVKFLDRINEGNPHYRPYMNPAELKK